MFYVLLSQFKMVFTQLMVIKGYLLSQNDVFDFVRFLQKNMKSIRHQYEFLRMDIDKIDDKDDWFMSYIPNINDFISRFKGIQLFTSPCCSDVACKSFILGNKIKSYDRLNAKCNNCPSPHTLCDNCLGQTENGFYDVTKIFDKITQINEFHVCKYCNNDKRGDSENCKFCNWRSIIDKNISLSPTDNKDIRLKDWISNRTANYYYMLDDCLSCS